MPESETAMRTLLAQLQRPGKITGPYKLTPEATRPDKRRKTSTI
jgi:hypothetical protein